MLQLCNNVPAMPNKVLQKNWQFFRNVLYNAAAMAGLLPPIPLESTILTVDLKNSQPLELINLTNSFMNLGEEYNRFVLSHPEFGETPGVKLYIREIKSGSIKADLIAIASVTAQGLIPMLGQTNTLIGFAKHLKAAYDYFTGKTEEKPVLHKSELGHLSSIIEPIAKDGGSQLNLITVVNNNVVQTFNIDSSEANHAQNAIGNELLSLQESQVRPHTKKVLYWYQARNDTQSRAGDRGIIESISPRPVKIEFDDEKIKDTMLHGVENPFLSGYIVDVLVETIQSKPVLYKVIRYHGPLETFIQEKLQLGE